MSSYLTDRGQQAAAISNAITRLHREHYGRGATTVRTIIQRNYVISFLDDIYTPVERTLLDAGREDDVRSTRQIFQQAMRGRFTNAVEEITQRKVNAFMSQVHVAPDLAVEIFVLEPESDDLAPDNSPTDTRARSARPSESITPPAPRL
jgi:uncharacterized protein YbcI